MIKTNIVFCNPHVVLYVTVRKIVALNSQFYSFEISIELFHDGWNPYQGYHPPAALTDVHCCSLLGRLGMDESTGLNHYGKVPNPCPQGCGYCYQLSRHAH